MKKICPECGRLMAVSKTIKKPYTWYLVCQKCGYADTVKD